MSGIDNEARDYSGPTGRMTDEVTDKALLHAKAYLGLLSFCIVHCLLDPSDCLDQGQKSKRAKKMYSQCMGVK